MGSWSNLMLPISSNETVEKLVAKNRFCCSYKNAPSGDDRISSPSTGTHSSAPIAAPNPQRRIIRTFLPHLPLCSHRIARSEVRDLLEVELHILRSREQTALPDSLVSSSVDCNHRVCFGLSVILRSLSSFISRAHFTTDRSSHSQEVTQIPVFRQSQRRDHRRRLIRYPLD